MKGKLIVIEGTDCSGKQTQGKLLEENLNKQGIKTITFSFPMYDTPTGKIIEGPLLGNEQVGKSWFPEGPVQVDPYITSLYFAADRKYNIKKIIPYIEEGYYVILDRYTSSNMAHKGSKILNKEDRFYLFQWIDKLEYWLLGLPKPDKTIFLHMPYLKSLELSHERANLDEVEKSPEHLKNAEQTYIELSELYHWDTIECMDGDRLKTREEIQEEILKHVL